MRTAFIGLVMLTATAVAQNQPSQFPAGLVDPILTGRVTVKHDLSMPAKDNGKLVELAVQEGDLVEADGYLGKIDDNEAKMAYMVAEAQLKSAVENAGRGSQIQLDYAVKAAEVAKVDFQRISQAFEKRAVTAMDYERARLEWQRAEAQIAVRELEQTLAEFEVSAKEAERDAAEAALARRTLKAPFAGRIVTRLRREGEWVQAGEPILRLMNFETMVVSGLVDATIYRRQDVAGRPVTVHIEMVRGEPVVLTGKITYVSDIADSQNNEFEVKAEVTNQRIGDHWLLPHATTVDMTIHVN
jgi:multidrug resistance efflux pump